MNLILGKTEALSPVLLAKVTSYRYKVFIESLGWERDTRAAGEPDSAQTDAAYRVLRHTDMMRQPVPALAGEPVCG